MVGAVDRAYRLLDESLAIARDIQDPVATLFCVDQSAFAASLNLDLERAVALSEEAMSLDEAIAYALEDERSPADRLG